jgi:hypothetical protein
LAWTQLPYGEHCGVPASRCALQLAGSRVAVISMADKIVAASCGMASAALLVPQYLLQERAWIRNAACLMQSLEVLPRRRLSRCCSIEQDGQ